MTRSPLFYPLNRGMDAEAGGIADLQTDVMRFMAILALCLVAIFALVQSIPLLPTNNETPIVVPQPNPPETPTPDVATVKPPTPEPMAQLDKPATLVAKPIVIERRPILQSSEEKPLVITRPAPQPVARRQAPRPVIEDTAPPQATETIAVQEEILEPPVPEPAPAAETEGFTLRFETDLALTRLVARNDVGLYAITPNKSLRMNVNRGALSFWAASLPNQFHEMDEATVPDEVIGALRRSGNVKTSDVKWGVTLPSGMRQQLDQHLAEFSGGSLIIGGDGNLRLER